MKFIYKKVNQPILKNTLKIIMSESTTGNNDEELWGANFTFIPENVRTQEEAESYIKGFFFIRDRINKSREGYGDTYNSIDFEDETGEVKDVEVDGNSEVIIFTCGNNHFEYPFEFDESMPTEDGRYFAGVKFVSAFYYDNEGNKFEIEIKEWK